MEEGYPMTAVNGRRMAGEIKGDFVLFLIGMRINTLWKVHKWLPVFRAMPRMLKRLEADPESGLLGYETKLGLRNHWVVQYWRSFEHLHAFATEEDDLHVPAWMQFNQSVGTNGDVGIWHETYLVKASQFEAIYQNMPPYGLARAADHVPATGRRHTATGRLGRTAGDDAPVDEEGNLHDDATTTH